MNILLYSTNGLLLERWQQLLAEKYTLRPATSEKEVEALAREGNYSLLLLHRSAVDYSFMAHLKELPFLVLADRPDDREAIDILRMGAAGYASSYISGPRLQDAVKVALDGQVWVGRKLMEKIIRGTSAKTSTAETTLENLTERELEVARLVAEGESNLEIAADLNISERTVKAHVSALFKKTKTASRLQLALFMNSKDVVK